MLENVIIWNIVWSEIKIYVGGVETDTLVKACHNLAVTFCSLKISTIGRNFGKDSLLSDEVETSDCKRRMPFPMFLEEASKQREWLEEAFKGVLTSTRWPLIWKSLWETSFTRRRLLSGVPQSMGLTFLLRAYADSQIVFREFGSLKYDSSMASIYTLSNLVEKLKHIIRRPSSSRCRHKDHFSALQVARTQEHASLYGGN